MCIRDSLRIESGTILAICSFPETKILAEAPSLIKPASLDTSTSILKVWVYGFAEDAIYEIVPLNLFPSIVSISAGDPVEIFIKSDSEISPTKIIGSKSSNVAQVLPLLKKSPSSIEILSTIPSKGALIEALSNSSFALSKLDLIF